MQSKTQILAFILLFYTVLTIYMGFIGSTINTNLDADYGEANNKLMSIDNIISGYSLLPVWINTIIFSTFILVLTFIIVTSLPTFNGGAWSEE